MLDIDEAIRPDLAEKQIRISAETALTNRLYALVEVVRSRPTLPMIEGEPDMVSFNAWRGVFMGSCDAIQEIAEATVNWASEDRTGSDA